MAEVVDRRVPWRTLAAKAFAALERAGGSAHWGIPRPFGQAPRAGAERRRYETLVQPASVV